MIHAFDYPPLASDALPAARAYAKIAPSSPHALHMPSHIFTRLGLWQESIASNLASADAARQLVARRHPGAASFDELHALDYLEYAYLQIGDEKSARRVLERGAAAKTFDEPNSPPGYALAAIPARWALERRDWKAAASLEMPAARAALGAVPLRARAIRTSRQALGAARSRTARPRRAALARLAGDPGRTGEGPASPGPTTGRARSRRRVWRRPAWLASREGRGDEALRLARAAADLEDRTGKHPVTPGPILPAARAARATCCSRRAGRPTRSWRTKSRCGRRPGRFNSLSGGSAGRRSCKGRAPLPRALPGPSGAVHRGLPEIRARRGAQGRLVVRRLTL